MTTPIFKCWSVGDDPCQDFEFLNYDSPMESIEFHRPLYSYLGNEQDVYNGYSFEDLSTVVNSFDHHSQGYDHGQADRRSLEDGTLGSDFHNKKNEKLLRCEKKKGVRYGDEVKSGGGKCNEVVEIGSGSKTLSREKISQYFYMPLSQAAKELNITLSLFKRRCREVGIRRWPYRNLTSLESLIKNVKELGEGQGDMGQKEIIDRLEKEKRSLEEDPDWQIEDRIKKFRQACFKANHRKRTLSRTESDSSSFSVLESSHFAIKDVEEDVMDSL